MPTGKLKKKKAKKESDSSMKDLIHYAVDKASPYALAQHPETDSYDDIEPYSLSSLAIAEVGLGLMWTWINAYSGQYGGKPVAASVASKCKTVKDVFDAVAAAT